MANPFVYDVSPLQQALRNLGEVRAGQVRLQMEQERRAQEQQRYQERKAWQEKMHSERRQREMGRSRQGRLEQARKELAEGRDPEVVNKTTKAVADIEGWAPFTIEHAAGDGGYKFKMPGLDPKMKGEVEEWAENPRAQVIANAQQRAEFLRSVGKVSPMGPHQTAQQHNRAQQVQTIQNLLAASRPADLETRYYLGSLGKDEEFRRRLQLARSSRRGGRRREVYPDGWSKTREEDFQKERRNNDRLSDALATTETIKDGQVVSRTKAAPGVAERLKESTRRLEQMRVARNKAYGTVPAAEPPPGGGTVPTERWDPENFGKVAMTILGTDDPMAALNAGDSMHPDDRADIIKEIKAIQAGGREAVERFRRGELPSGRKLKPQDPVKNLPKHMQRAAKTVALDDTVGQPDPRFAADTSIYTGF